MKNAFIIQLGALYNLASAKKELDGELMEASQCVIREWNEHSVETQSLIEAFRTEESPRMLFLIQPLANCDEETKSWLPDYIHQNWLQTYPVDRWIQDATSAWREVDERTRELRAAIEQSQSSIETLVVIVNVVRHSVSALSDAISLFPSRQLI
ncbi:MAG: hypothetical protein ACFE0O_04515 [Opitutales bacterium]